jgi:transcriptional regulator with XRE-family HTH domain
LDISLVIRQRLVELGVGQKELAGAAQVTESYISQLLARKKAPPAPGRTDLYDKIGGFLQLPAGELARMAEAQRRLEFHKRAAEPPAPLFRECRGLILRKCEAGRRQEMRRIFEKDAFGELERMVTQRLLDVVQGVAREELRSEEWLRLMAQLSDRSFEQMRVAILEFLDSDIFHVSPESCVSFLDPAIETWDFDLKTFGMEVTLNRRLAPGGVRRFEYMEKTEDAVFRIEPAFEQFLNDKTLSGDATEDEIEFLKKMKFGGRRPTALYYYRELQSLRDPLHFAAEEFTRR